MLMRDPRRVEERFAHYIAVLVFGQSAHLSCVEEFEAETHGSSSNGRISCANLGHTTSERMQAFRNFDSPM